MLTFSAIAKFVNIFIIICYAYFMSLVSKILRELWNTSLSYKGVRVNLFGIPILKNHSYGTMQVTLSRLRKNGIINNGDKGWYLTSAGKKYMKIKLDSFEQFPNSFKKDAPKNLIVMFDIPETKKAEREWFRWHLKKFHYVMIQKSVWVGPSPLPEEFMEYIKKIKLRDTLKTFRLARSYDFKRQN